MDDDFIDEAWIAAGPPPEEQDKSGCLGLVLLVLSAAGGAFVGIGLWVSSFTTFFIERW